MNNEKSDVNEKNIYRHKKTYYFALFFKNLITGTSVVINHSNISLPFSNLKKKGYFSIQNILKQDKILCIFLFILKKRLNREKC